MIQDLVELHKTDRIIWSQSNVSQQAVALVAVGAFLGPLELNAVAQQHKMSAGVVANATNQRASLTRNSTTATTIVPMSAPKVNGRQARSAQTSLSLPSKSTARNSMGDTTGLATALASHGDLTAAAGEHGKKYILVKKKPKPKKIKMEVYEPKMKYKKIKMKVPVKTMKKKKVKGYLVKKHHHHH